MMSSDAFFFLLGAVLAGLIGTSVWALDGAAGDTMDLSFARNGVTMVER